MHLPPGLDQLEARAREHLSAGAYAYYADAAYSDVGRESTTDARNRRAWDRWYLCPRVLVDVREVGTETTFLGSPVRLPVATAPCAYNAFAHPGAEIAVARGVAEAGALQIVSTAASVPPVEVAKATPDPKWFQLYSDVDRRETDRRVREAEDAGFRALVLTVDAPVGAPRYAGYPEQGFGPVATGAVLDPGLDWRELERIVAFTELPLVLKGLVHPEDARRARETGVRGIVVSNHGGRQLDGAVPTAVALPHVVDAVEGALEVYVDGGVRSARDVLRALALGARGVLLGRMTIWALAIAGQAGVAELFARLGDELRNAMMLTGQTHVASVSRDILLAEGSAGAQ